MIHLLPIAWCLLLAGCSGIQSALDPAGPGATRIGQLCWLMLSVCAVVFVAVLVMLLFAIARRSRRTVEAASGTVRVDPHRER